MLVLKEHIDKKIKITLNDGEILIGKCIKFIPASENDPEIDSIDLQIGKDVYEIFHNEIEGIEIM